MISILIFLSAVHAGPRIDPCSEVDLRAKFGPVRDQGPTESCYAYTAADLLGATAPEPLKTPISALHVAANFAARTPGETAQQRKKYDIIKNYSVDSPADTDRRMAKEMHGKTFEERINVGAQLLTAPILSSMDKPLCTELELPSEPKSHFKADPMAALNDKWTRDPNDEDAAYAFLFKSMREPEQSLIPEALQPCKACEKFKAPSLPQFMKKDLTPSLHDWAAPIIAKKMTEKCRMKTTIPSAKVRDLFVDSLDDSEMKLLNTQLGRGNPVGIGYDVCYFTNPANASEKREGCPHASSIVGRKRNKKTGLCEYLVRNSYGEKCEDYKKGVKCEGGYFWATESKLMDAVQELVWIERNPNK